MACACEIGDAELQDQGSLGKSTTFLLSVFPMESNEKSWNQIPLWSGQPETFSHFIHEVKWTLCSSKKEDRSLLAARIVRKALPSGQPTLMQLMYKLDPSDFKSEGDVQKLIGYLESSPLNRQALPNAGQKIGSYYRRLAKRPGESVPAFLVREDKVHDEMLKALQRLLREKELDNDGYNLTLAELKRFVGMEPEASLLYGEHEPSGAAADDEDQEEAGSQKSSQRTATPSRDGVPFSRRSQSAAPSDSPSREKEKPKGKDVLELLMAKGLIPLAALDVIRGWMLLEMATSGEEERRLIRAATRNKLGYFDIKSALLSMYEEQDIVEVSQDSLQAGISYQVLPVNAMVEARQSMRKWCIISNRSKKKQSGSSMSCKLLCSRARGPWQKLVAQ